MVEAGGHPRLAQQVLAILLRKVRLAHDLEGNVPVEQLVVGAVDDGHPAAPDLRAQAEAVVEQPAGIGVD